MELTKLRKKSENNKSKRRNVQQKSALISNPAVCFDEFLDKHHV